MSFNRSSNRRLSLGLADRRIFLIVLCVVVSAVMTALSPYFLHLASLLNMTQFGAVIGLLALGETLVILGGGGGIDLSVGSMLSLSGISMGLLLHAGVNVWVAALLAVLIGIALGAFNGFLVVAMRLAPLIATLGTEYAYSSLAQVLANGTLISGFHVSGFNLLGQSQVFNIPLQILLVLLPSYIVLGVALAYTRFGRNLYEVGNNERAAYLVGISPGRVRLSVYCLSGMLAAIGAVVTNSWLLAARPGAGDGYELQAITIAVLGGTDIFGGRGTISGTLLAVLLIVIITTGLQLANVDTVWQMGVLGAILIASVLLNNIFTRRTHLR